MNRKETREEAEARYASWADAAGRGEFHPTGAVWINLDRPGHLDRRGEER